MVRLICEKVRYVLIPAKYPDLDYIGSDGSWELYVDTPKADLGDGGFSNFCSAAEKNFVQILLHIDSFIHNFSEIL